MKVNLPKPPRYFGPVQLAEKILFWLPEDHDWIDWLGDILAYGKVRPTPRGRRNILKDPPETTWLFKLLVKIDGWRQPKNTVRIDRWDTWSVDSTLSQIILPLLKQFRDVTQSSPCVDMEDVPEHLRISEQQQQQTNSSGEVDPLFHQRWQWVLDEMIFAFQHLVDTDWEDQYRSGNIDLEFVPVGEDGEEIPDSSEEEPKWYRMETGADHSRQVDQEAIDAINSRIQNGLRLFGKYYTGLWS